MVSNETELRTAVDNAPLGGTAYVIVITSDIPLERGPLIIPTGVNITLTTDDSAMVRNLTAVGNFGVIAIGDYSTLNVKNRGELRLDGICVTHAKGVYGIGVSNHGDLYLYNGAISDNNISPNSIISDGGGVYNRGNFTIFGSTISNNTCGSFLSLGGGVYNEGNFTMWDSVISGNTASWRGGGVSNQCHFHKVGLCAKNGILPSMGDKNGTYQQNN